jgi:hypothetical protein
MPPGVDPRVEQAQWTSLCAWNRAGRRWSATAIEALADARREMADHLVRSAARHNAPERELEAALAAVAAWVPVLLEPPGDVEEAAHIRNNSRGLRYRYD